MMVDVGHPKVEGILEQDSADEKIEDQQKDEEEDAQACYQPEETYYQS